MNNLQKKFFWVCLSFSIFITFVVLAIVDAKIMEIFWVYVSLLFGSVITTGLSLSQIERPWKNLKNPVREFRQLFSEIRFWIFLMMVSLLFISDVSALLQFLLPEEEMYTTSFWGILWALTSIALTPGAIKLLKGTIKHNLW